MPKVFYCIASDRTLAHLSRRLAAALISTCSVAVPALSLEQYFPPGSKIVRSMSLLELLFVGRRSPSTAQSCLLRFHRHDFFACGPARFVSDIRKGRVDGSVIQGMSQDRRAMTPVQLSGADQSACKLTQADLSSLDNQRRMGRSIVHDSFPVFEHKFELSSLARLDHVIACACRHGFYDLLFHGIA